LHTAGCHLAVRLTQLRHLRDIIRPVSSGA
jgi:hypothetical protein